MNSNTYEEFQDLLYELKVKKENIQKQIDDNTLQIIEARSYAKEILNREEEDFKVFSPRKVEDIYKDELEKANVKQVTCENQNQRLTAKIEELDSIISVLEKVAAELSRIHSIENHEECESEEINVSEQVAENNIEEIYCVEKSDVPDMNMEVIQKSVQNLNSLRHKVDLSMKFIQQDPIRTKIELETVSKGINRVSKKLSGLTTGDID